MLENITRFNMTKKPMRQHLRPLVCALSYPALIAHKNHIEKNNMDGIKPPYLLLCNHNAFMDFKVATAAIFPHRANYVVAIDGYLKREWLLRLVGCVDLNTLTDTFYIYPKGRDFAVTKLALATEELYEHELTAKNGGQSI